MSQGHRNDTNCQMRDNLITKVQSKLLEKQEFIIHTNNKKGCEECS